MGCLTSEYNPNALSVQVPRPPSRSVVAAAARKEHDHHHSVPIRQRFHPTLTRSIALEIISI
jgi:hypothetical protein